MTVTRPYEYGKTEVGNRGYSSFVSAILIDQWSPGYSLRRDDG